MTAAKRRAIDSLRRGRMLVQKHEEIARELEWQQQPLGDALEHSRDQVIDDDILRSSSPRAIRCSRWKHASPWDRIVLLYDALLQGNPPPVVALNRADAVGMAQGPAAGLDALNAIAALAGYHLFPRVRGDLLMKMGGFRGRVKKSDALSQ